MAQLNEFGFIDYKKPLGNQSDMRTSTYLGHKHMTDTMLGNHLHAKYGQESRPYECEPKLEELRCTDYHGNYVWKYGDPNEIRNPTLPRKVDFIKSYDECQIRFLKRPILPARSVSHQDYKWRPVMRQEPPLPIHMPADVQTESIVIDRSKVGYAKYLDPSSTTSRLAYVKYTPKQLEGGVAAKDNITFWNWEKIQDKPKRVFRERDDQMCDYSAAKECVKRHCEFASLVKHVPNKGLTTEVRENYVEPHTRAIDFDITHVRNQEVYLPTVPFAKRKEYDIYGSGERTQKFV